MDVQPNGEPKKIYLNKPVENKPEEKPASSRSKENKGQPDCVLIPPPRRRPPPPDNTDEEENITNHKKQRYWNSFEEMHIIELWRRYKDEVTEFNKALPVHRKIMVGMRQKGMIVTGQDCRRKLNTLNNRYKAELESQKLTGAKSEWRLFPLIHCIKSPKFKQFDPWHETLVTRKLLEKIPKVPEQKQPAPAVLRQTSNATHTPTNRQNPMTPNTAPSQLVASIPLKSLASGVGSLIAMDTYNPPAPLPPARSANHNPAHRKNVLKYSIPAIRSITKKKLEQLKLENVLLAQQRDDALKSLRMAERKQRMFEAILHSLFVQAEKGIHGENLEKLLTKC